MLTEEMAHREQRRPFNSTSSSNRLLINRATEFNARRCSLQTIRPLSILCVIALLLTNISIAAQETPAMHKLQLLDCSGLPCVDATLQSGRKIRLLIDTGNVNSVVDSTVAKELGITVDPLLGRDGKPRAGYGSSVLQDLRLGDSEFGDLRVVVMDLATDIKRG